MSRFIHPKSVRYGNLCDWVDWSESSEGYLKIKAFIDYIEAILKNYLYVEEGIVLSKLSLKNNQERLNIEIRLYDRVLELSLREAIAKGGTGIKEVEQLLGDKLLIIKRLILSEGVKYFKKDITVEFYFVGMLGIDAQGLARYISYNLERGYSLAEILRIISGEFRGGGSVDEERNKGGLSHRYDTVYSEGLRSFRKLAISGRYLLGYRIDLAGRFSRKQRASKRSICEGTVPLGSYSGSMDYAFTEAIMDYGVSSVRVWFYYDRDRVNQEYLCVVK